MVAAADSLQALLPCAWHKQRTARNEIVVLQVQAVPNSGSNVETICIGHVLGRIFVSLAVDDSQRQTPKSSGSAPKQPCGLLQAFRNGNELCWL